MRKEHPGRRMGVKGKAARYAIALGGTPVGNRYYVGEERPAHGWRNKERKFKADLVELCLPEMRKPIMVSKSDYETIMNKVEVLRRENRCMIIQQLGTGKKPRRLIIDFSNPKIAWSGGAHPVSQL